jgi:hypothetical protein
MSTQNPRGKNEPVVPGGPTAPPQWDVPDLIEEPPGPRSTQYRGGPEVAVPHGDLIDTSRSSFAGTSEVDTRQSPSLGLLDPDDEAQSPIHLELDVPSNPAGDPASVDPANAGQGACGAETERSSGFAAPRQPESLADRQTVASRATAPTEPRKRQPWLGAAALAQSRFTRGHTPALSLVAAAMLVRLGTCAYSAASGREASSGWLVGLLLIGAAALFLRRWWAGSHRG